MDVIKNLEGASDYIKELPKPPTYLDKVAKAHYQKIGRVLISSEKLKRIHLSALEVMAVNLEQWEWAVREISRKNKRKKGTGYMQTFASKAQNLSVEVTLKRDAEKAIMQCFKQFGLDPKSEKELTAAVDPVQGDLFTGFNNMKKAKR